VAKYDCHEISLWFQELSTACEGTVLLLQYLDAAALELLAAERIAWRWVSQEQVNLSLVSNKFAKIGTEVFPKSALLGLFSLKRG
jgi:hypothetical protein